MAVADVCCVLVPTAVLRKVIQVVETRKPTRRAAAGVEESKSGDVDMA